MAARANPIGPLSRRGAIRFALGMLLLALLVAAAAWSSASGLAWERTASGLRYRVIAEGEGPRAGATDVVQVNYTGRLQDGTVFDSNEGRPPAEMFVGGVVPGFGEALQLMNKGSTLLVRIPPELGYGANVPPGGRIPPNATLEFDITLVDSRPLTPEEMQQLQQMQMMQMMQQQMQQGGEPGHAEGPGGD